MIKGVLLAVVLLLVGDLALNEGQVTHLLRTRLTHYAASSSDAVHNSVFRW